jgi:hypothetical protein
MVQTRSMSKTLKRRSARNSYARRVRKSACRGITRNSCYRKKKCRFAKGKTRKFCRKAKNTKRRMKGGNTTHMSSKGSAMTHGTVH